MRLQAVQQAANGLSVCCPVAIFIIGLTSITLTPGIHKNIGRTGVKTKYCFGFTGWQHTDIGNPA